MILTRREFLKLGLAAGASLMMPRIAMAATPPNVLWIGWDGADYRSVTALLRSGMLPNLANLRFRRLDCVGATVTKPGWVEIVTGYEYPVTEIYDNKVRDDDECLSCAFKEVPLEWILFYRIKQELGSYWCGCIFSKTAHTGDGEGEPWNQLKDWGGLDYYVNASAGAFTIEETNGYLLDNAIPAYNTAGGGLIFCHYCKPDGTGHQSGMDSPQYLDDLEALDEALGKAISQMSPQPDCVIVCSDHGFNGPEKHGHSDAPNGILASNLDLEDNCARRDLGYTVTKMLGLPVETYDPPLRGKDIRKL